ncbi:hypothetical protein [Fervidibacillus halotolerans]|uniref:Lipoprotein n=1 Tax=Fervidibacillus halotolerans TaxID=2980027 RepID=A0A9E8RZ04_9BACI|nr:hypothetical protein [Fervidibacillus halotolerans]WAA12689.1 hypothetical protein OE105_00665 [Fervidibacillus halotolerans]
MKKIFRMLLLMSLISFTLGCSNMYNKPPMALYIKNNSAFDFYSVELTWHKSRNDIRTQVVVNADGTAMKKGELIPFYFNSSDFVSGQKTTFEIAVFVDPSQRNKITIDPPISLYYTNDEKYYLSISGNTIDHLVIQLDEQSDVERNH